MTQLSDSMQVLLLLPIPLNTFTEQDFLKKQTTYYLVTYWETELLNSNHNAA